MVQLTVYEFDSISADVANPTNIANLHHVPQNVFDWLDRQALYSSSTKDSAWLRLSQKKGLRTVQITSFVGIIQAPNNYQIEVLPKIAKINEHNETRKILITMLQSLTGFEHIKIDRANLRATQMPLLEVFLLEFLNSVEDVIKYGLRSDYNHKEENIFALRGKLKIKDHIQHNLFRRDRFFVEFDEFSLNRAENRILHTALNKVINLTKSLNNLQLAKKLSVIFDDIPLSTNLAIDFQKIKLQRGMDYYNSAIAWAKLILQGQSPITMSGKNNSISLLFPMNKVFEAYVGKCLRNQIKKAYSFKSQVKNKTLIYHLDKKWFLMKPDFLITCNKENKLILDTKWKLLNSQNMNGIDKYGLLQSDFYQLYAYGQYYLQGEGDVVLIYPKTDDFEEPLAKFVFLQNNKLNLWVLPFCLKTSRLILPDCGSLDEFFVKDN